MAGAPRRRVGNRRHILVAAADAHFRQQVLNFLLSEGFQFVDSSADRIETIEKIQNTSYDVVVLEAGTSGPEGLVTAGLLRRLKPGLGIILAIEAKDQGKSCFAGEGEFPFMLKSAFASDLLYLLEIMS